MNRLSILATAIAALAGLAAAGPAAAQSSYPSRPVRVIVAFAPGGNADIMIRLMAQGYTTAFGQPFTVENVSGAGGNIGTEAVAKAAPDGHTLLGIPSISAIAGSLYENLSFDVNRDLVPIGMIATTPYVLVASKASGAKTVAELVALAKSRPKGLNFGSGGIGGGSHLTGEMLKMKTGTEMTHVAYRGGAGAINDTISGTLDFVFDSLTSGAQQAKNGTVTALAVSSAKRSDLLPEVPTFIESGMPEFEFYIWTGMMAPTGTPRPVIASLNAALNKTLADPAVKDRLTQLGGVPSPSTPEAFGAVVKAEAERWAPVIKAANIKAQ